MKKIKFNLIDLIIVAYITHVVNRFQAKNREIFAFSLDILIYL